MRVQFGEELGQHDPPVVMSQRGSEPLLLVRHGEMTPQVVHLLDRMLRSFEPKGLTRAMYNVTQAATELGVSESWLRRRVRNNTIPFRRIGSRLLFSAEDMREIWDEAYRGPI